MKELTSKNLHEIKQEIEEWFKNIKSYKFEVYTEAKLKWDNIRDCVYVKSNPVNIGAENSSIIIDVDYCKYSINNTDKIAISKNEFQYEANLLYSGKTTYRFTKLN